tara:strand:+ start:1003 stop:1389 length:387 start_codon:yes stop_codon:yes gene_type:complete
MDKKNWNNLTEKEQTILERITNKDVFVNCNELMYGLFDGEHFDGVNNWDDEYDTLKEPMEYYIISSDLYKHLENVDAYLINYKGLEIWARCETNQSISMDWELKQVAKNIQSFNDKIEKEYQARVRSR